MNSSVKPIVIIGAGQSGLAAARVLRDRGMLPLVLEASSRPAGSWPQYYDSLRLFSPARFSAMPGMPFPGDPDGYPTRDEVTAYLENYAASLDVDIRTDARVESVHADGPGFVVTTRSGAIVQASGIVAATGSFSNPYRPHLPGQDAFGGELVHVADYREPGPYIGRRVVVVGGGNSGVQVARELAEVADVTVATSHPIAFMPQLIDGRDVHHLLTGGFDTIPPQWLAKLGSAPIVIDTGGYQETFESGLLNRREMFTGFDGDTVVWPDGPAEAVDAVVHATGYRPSLDYLRPLGALDPDGLPLHSGGISTTCLGLVYVGIEFQRSFASNTLRGVTTDAEAVLPPLIAHVRGLTGITG